MKIQKITLLAVLMAMAIALSALEHLIPTIGVPGIKLGLANIVILLILCEFGLIEALIVNLGRVIIASLITGNIVNLMGFLMSLTGALLSLLVMWLVHKLLKKFSLVGVSIFGSIFHIVGQMIIAIIFIGKEMLYYFPFILLASIITGILVGIVSKLVINTKIIEKMKDKYNFN